MSGVELGADARPATREEMVLIGYIRPWTIKECREGRAGPLVGVPAFDTEIPVYIRREDDDVHR